MMGRYPEYSVVTSRQSTQPKRASFYSNLLILSIITIISHHDYQLYRLEDHRPAYLQGFDIVILQICIF